MVIENSAASRDIKDHTTVAGLAGSEFPFQKRALRDDEVLYPPNVVEHDRTEKGKRSKASGS